MAGLTPAVKGVLQAQANPTNPQGCINLVNESDPDSERRLKLVFKYGGTEVTVQPNAFRF